jgi:hypothetical protein
VTLWSENAAAATHPAHNNDYYLWGLLVLFVEETLASRMSEFSNRFSLTQWPMAAVRLSPVGRPTRREDLSR